MMELEEFGRTKDPNLRFMHLPSSHKSLPKKMQYFAGYEQVSRKKSVMHPMLSGVWFEQVPKKRVLSTLCCPDFGHSLPVTVC